MDIEFTWNDLLNCKCPLLIYVGISSRFDIHNVMSDDTVDNIEQAGSPI
jgi:hypothetical protein